MSSRRNSGNRYYAGALMLIGLMLIAIILGWYGLQIAKETATNTTSPQTPTPMQTASPMNSTETSMTSNATESASP